MHDWKVRPAAHCDVVMKGGITSGVIYPRAISELAKNYRLRGLGGSSAGAIGAALGAAAEYGRGSARGGFAYLDTLPEQLHLDEVFTPQTKTRPLFELMIAATSSTAARGKSRFRATASRFIEILSTGYRGATALGLLPAAIFFFSSLFVLIAFAFGLDSVVGIVGFSVLIIGVIIITGLIAAIGWTVAMVVTLYRELTITIPENMFGICTGMNDEEPGKGLTEWLATQIDTCAGLPKRSRPLTFGQLMAGPEVEKGMKREPIDLQMVSTCLSWSRPVSMPFSAKYYFYSEDEWSKLFPEYVMAALRKAPLAPVAEDDDDSDDEKAARHVPPLRRLPDQEHLPVIVATRLSLSFPLLISAVPLWSPNRSTPNPDEPESFETFDRLWFTDGGLVNNFPVQMFDGALPTGPTFAINLGKFPAGTGPSDDPNENIEYFTRNRGIRPPYRPIPARGIGAVTGFLGAAVDTARNSQDRLQLEISGYRDRVVLVKQSKTEGGLNLKMEPGTVSLLAERGRFAAESLSAQFRENRYPTRDPSFSGWENHVWVRYRALLASLPTFLRSFEAGHKELSRIRTAHGTLLPSYTKISASQLRVADAIAEHLNQAAKLVHTQAVRTALEKEPRPIAPIRRVPQI